MGGNRTVQRTERSPVWLEQRERGEGISKAPSTLGLESSFLWEPSLKGDCKGASVDGQRATGKIVQWVVELHYPGGKRDRGKMGAKELVMSGFRMERGWRKSGQGRNPRQPGAVSAREERDVAGEGNKSVQLGSQKRLSSATGRSHRTKCPLDTGKHCGHQGPQRKLFPRRSGVGLDADQQLRHTSRATAVPRGLTTAV